MDVCVNTDDDNVREHIAGADDVHDIWVLERDLLGDLHHHKDDNQVGAARRLSVLLSRLQKRHWGTGAHYIWGESPAIAY